MTQESKFNEFFEELGGIDNLKLMVNMGDIMYGEENGFPAMYFTLGWKNRAHFRVLGKITLRDIVTIRAYTIYT